MTDDGLHAAPYPVRAAAAVIRRLPIGRHRAAQWVAARVGSPFWAELPPQLGSLRFRCDLADGLMRDAYLTGRYEPQETALVRHLLRPGMTFADVGANWGYFTLLAAHLVGPSGRVIAVEADPRAVQTIRANVASNALHHVRLFGVAATDEARELSFDPYEPALGSASGNYGLEQAGDAAARPGRVRVAGRPLDELFAESGVDRIDLMKMDIEGAEAAALRGAARFLAAGRIDRIVLELHPEALQRLGSSVGAVCGLLRDAGFDGWRIDHSLEAHRRAASARVDVDALLLPLDGVDDLGRWPHVFWRRKGLAS